MAKKKSYDPGKKRTTPEGVMGLHAQVLEQPITDTLELNYMPYAMSVIISRAIPEIDGFKPSHRKLLYTMYQMKLLSGGRTKSANVVGATMKLNPHGDSAIYETMVRLSRGYGALLHPPVDSKGNFGKVYSRDMAYAASRYTEVKLDGICQELFRDIDKNVVDFVPNYDGTLTEPLLLPTSFPNILVSANMGIAVGMASNLCGFNLSEVCDAAIARIKDPQRDLLDCLKAPDFPTGGLLLYDRKEMEAIYRTGRGSFKVRAKWRYVKSENLIEIYEIPYTTTAEAILDKVAELIKAGKIREIADMRDETDLSGLKLAIDLKRGTDPDKLMQKLFRATPLQDSFACNFNILINGMPKVMGVGEILDHWTAWRTDCVRRSAQYTLDQKTEKLHLLRGLAAILLDIDKAIAIIRNTELDAMVVPNLMEGFGLDRPQADYVADIRLRNINKEYILKRTGEIEQLEKDIADLTDLIQKPARIRREIIKQLEGVKKAYGVPRRTEILSQDQLAEETLPQEDVPSYPVHLFLSREGYFKKITPQSLRMSGEQKYKEGDGPAFHWETTSAAELLLFTDQQQCYKTWANTFDDTKASVLGDYLPARLEMDEGESLFWACLPGDYTGHLLFFFANGKVARVPLAAYQTVTKRKKLTGAYSDKSPLVAVLFLKEGQEEEILFTSTEGRALCFSSQLVPLKTTRSTQGVQVMTLKKNHKADRAAFLDQTPVVNQSRYRARSLPAAGALLKAEDQGDTQLSLL
ncbi:MAG: DNA topoisomerase (ATP-hydrolyzing) subunit A [Evtepia sp.]|uniref:DNA topoisomerase (ATP-hydrolyzing) subunit A n=1 Tax=Evtepia sp. TaxID=2773933 RepID=UPI002A7650DB|nr:DNA topoisomerase (ATP-hydrolyzing) subunit A [Evtepia sp.]MDY3014269.1 DNA topoisomerase (ATP-hydrolyzing) subunit A [Evtepia sp.]